MTEHTSLRENSMIDVIRMSVRFQPKNSLSALNKTVLARVIHAQLRGATPTPFRLGMTPADYDALLKAIGDAALLEHSARWQMPNNSSLHARSAIIEQLMAPRLEERNALFNLLVNHLADGQEYGLAVASIIATACLSPAHLWASLGLSSREALHTWLAHNFPSLVAKNTQNMRWKRFFYLQLCQSEGDYVCRAPSCTECSSYAQCFVS